MLRRVFFAFLLVFGLAQAALAERRVALVLATEDYKSVRKLENPVNDARAMEKLLEGLGFEVWLETDRDLKRTRRALADFEADAAGADIALVFFAGHGVALEGVNYLLPTDADATSSETLATTSLGLAEVQATLAKVAPQAIVLLDACRDDPFATGGSEDGRGAVPLSGDPPEKPPPVPGLGRIGRADGVLFAFAAAPGETASDGDGENSPFTAAMLRHFGTKGVELKSALTLVQQDVYDRSRGQQLPYLESGLAELVFISEKGELPERDQLLMAMADLTPELRAEVEATAAGFNMPLAPLYGAVLEGNLADLSAEERQRKLEDAARSYAQFQEGFAKFSSSDPRVTDLRARAEEQLALGATTTARDLISQAAEIDAEVRLTMKDNIAEQVAVLVERTVSEATSHILNARAASTDLRYDLAIGDLTQAVELYAEVEADLPDRDTQLAYNFALADLGNLQMTAGNLYGALGAFMTQAEYAEARVKETPLDYAWLRELFWSQNRVGEVLRDQGFLAEAEEAYQRAYEISAKQNQDFPGDPALQRDLSFALVSLGELRLSQSDFAGALSAFQESLGYVQLALDNQPDDHELQREVAHAYERVGDVLFAMGQRDEARDAYDLALRSSLALIRIYPNDSAIKRDLSVRYERLGDVVVAEGDLDAGLAAYNEALRIREELQAMDPGNASRKRETALIYGRVADVYLRMGDPGTALMNQELARSVRAELVALDPSNMAWARDLTISLERIGDIYLGEGDPQGALAAYGEARDVREAILARDPGNLQSRRDLGIALFKVGQAIAGAGDMQAALAAQEETLQFRRDTLNADPTVSLHVIDVYFTLREISTIRRQAGDLAAAETALTEVVMLTEGALASAVQPEAYLYDLTSFAWELATAILDQGEPLRALSPAERAVKAGQELMALQPDDLGAEVQLMLAANTLGVIHRQLEDPASAQEAYQIMVGSAYRLAVAKSGDIIAASDYAAALYWLGSVKIAQKDYVGARADLEVAVSIRKWVVIQTPEDIVMQRDLGYALQKLADTHYYVNDFDNAQPLDEQALVIMQWVNAKEPGQVWNIIDVVDALDRTASYAGDPGAELQEAVALLEGLEAEGALPEGYADRLATYRQRLNGN